MHTLVDERVKTSGYLLKEINVQDPCLLGSCLRHAGIRTSGDSDWTGIRVEGALE